MTREYREILVSFTEGAHFLSYKNDPLNFSFVFLKFGLLTRCRPEMFCSCLSSSFSTVKRETSKMLAGLRCGTVFCANFLLINAAKEAKGKTTVTVERMRKKQFCAGFCPERGGRNLDLVQSWGVGKRRRSTDLRIAVGGGGILDKEMMYTYVLHYVRTRNVTKTSKVHFMHSVPMLFRPSTYQSSLTLHSSIHVLGNSTVLLYGTPPKPS